MRGVSRSAFVAALVLGMAIGAQAQTQTWNASIPTTVTNWGPTNLSFPLFNPALGTLTSIDFFLTGGVSGNVQFESLDGSSATINTDLKAQVKLTRPDNSTLVTVLPTVSHSDSATPFDGAIDFGGTSGKSYLGVTGSANNSFSSSSGADLALFTGVGNINLPVSAQGTSTASGAGNLITFFQTNANAQVQVVYHYQPALRTSAPEPGSVALLGLGIAGFVAVRRRRA